MFAGNIGPNDSRTDASPDGRSKRGAFIETHNARTNGHAIRGSFPVADGVAIYLAEYSADAVAVTCPNTGANVAAFPRPNSFANAAALAGSKRGAKRSAYAESI